MLSEEAPVEPNFRRWQSKRTCTRGTSYELTYETETQYEHSDARHETTDSFAPADRHRLKCCNAVANLPSRLSQ